MQLITLKDLLVKCAIRLRFQTINHLHVASNHIYAEFHLFENLQLLLHFFPFGVLKSRILEMVHSQKRGIVSEIDKKFESAGNSAFGHDSEQ